MPVSSRLRRGRGGARSPSGSPGGADTSAPPSPPPRGWGVQNARLVLGGFGVCAAGSLLYVMQPFLRPIGWAALISVALFDAAIDMSGRMAVCYAQARRTGLAVKVVTAFFAAQWVLQALGTIGQSPVRLAKDALSGPAALAQRLLNGQPRAAGGPESQPESESEGRSDSEGGGEEAERRAEGRRRAAARGGAALACALCFVAISVLSHPGAAAWMEVLRHRAEGLAAALLPSWWIVSLSLLSAPLVLFLLGKVGPEGSPHWVTCRELSQLSCGLGFLWLPGIWLLQVVSVHTSTFTIIAALSFIGASTSLVRNVVPEGSVVGWGQLLVVAIALMLVETLGRGVFLSLVGILWTAAVFVSLLLDFVSWSRGAPDHGATAVEEEPSLAQRAFNRATDLFAFTAPRPLRDFFWMDPDCKPSLGTQEDVATTHPGEEDEAAAEGVVSTLLLVTSIVSVFVGCIVVCAVVISDISQVSQASVESIRLDIAWEDASWETANTLAETYLSEGAWETLGVPFDANSTGPRDLREPTLRYVELGRAWIVDSGREQVIDTVAGAINSAAGAQLVTFEEVEAGLEQLIDVLGIGANRDEHPAAVAAGDGSAEGEPSSFFGSFAPVQKLFVLFSADGPITTTVSSVASQTLQVTLTVMRSTLSALGAALTFVLSIFTFIFALSYFLLPSAQKKMRNLLPEFLISDPRVQHEMVDRVTGTIEGALGVTLKRPLFFFLTHWLVLHLFDVQLLLGPCLWGICAGMLALIAFISPWMLTIPAVVSLCVRGEVGSAVLMFAIHWSLLEPQGNLMLGSAVAAGSGEVALARNRARNRAGTRRQSLMRSPPSKSAVARRVVEAVSSNHPALMLLAIYGGFATIGGLEGVVAGQLALCLVLVAGDLVAAWLSRKRDDAAA